MSSVSLPRRELYATWRMGNGTSNRKAEQLENVISSFKLKYGWPEDVASQARVRSGIQRHVDHLEDRWKKCGRNHVSFERRFKAWLDLPDFLLNFSIDNTLAAGAEKKTGGRPLKSWDKCAPRAKRLKSAKLREGRSANELCHAAAGALEAEGRSEEALLVRCATLSSPPLGNDMLNCWKLHKDKIPSAPLDGNEALAFMVKHGISKQRYIDMRMDIKSVTGAKFLPSYDVVCQAKLECYPEKDTNVSDLGATISLQSLLDLTTSRLFLALKDVLATLPHTLPNKFKLVSKWGCDGASGHSEYKQNSTETDLCDSNLFLVMLVPLRLYVETPSGQLVVWQNPTPSSTNYCRPLRFEFKKETKEVTVKEVASVNQEISNLQTTCITLDNSNVLEVSHDLHFTMLDGKVAAAITDKGAQNCIICGAKPSDMNNLQKLSKLPVNTSNLGYGLSSLHAWIRSMEYFLHIAYRMDFKCWRATGQENKKLKSDQEQRIQAELKAQLGIIVDKPRSGGSGNSNDGNTARRFFRSPVKSAEVLGIEPDVVRRMAVILQALSSGHEINADSYKEYAEALALKLTTLYAWYFMPSSVHKLLIHGSQIILDFSLPIGLLSEDAQEGRNKDCRNIRQFHTRKVSRSATNTDLLHALLVSSDPLITSLRRIRKRDKMSLSAEVLSLLKEPNTVIPRAVLLE